MMTKRSASNMFAILAIAAVVASAVWYKSRRVPAPVEGPVAAGQTEPSASTTQPLQTPISHAAEVSAQPVSRPASQPVIVSAPSAPTSQEAEVKRPRLVDLGAGKCKACKDLAPILVALREEYRGRLTVEYIDVWKYPKAAEPYKIRLIPTQILYDKDGKEVWRHEGFISKKDLKTLFAEKVGVR